MIKALPGKISQKLPNLPLHESRPTGERLHSEGIAQMSVSFQRCSGEEAFALNMFDQNKQIVLPQNQLITW